MTDVRRAASVVSLSVIQAAVLSEYLCNIEDRHVDNLFIERERHNLRLIDFSNAFKDPGHDSLLLVERDADILDLRESFTQALWVFHPAAQYDASGALVILDEVLDGLVSSHAVFLNALARFDLLRSALDLVIRRFRLLERLRSETSPATVDALNQLANN